MERAALTTKIPVKDRDGRIIDEKEVATYQGLLSLAHEEGLKEISTRLLQVPGPDNGDTAIVEAVVETGKGRFGGLGDANPGNVNRRVAAHLIRMAETRAKARALRDAVNIGVVALEELGGEDEDAPRARPSRPPIREVPRRGEPEDRRPPANAQPRVPERQPDPRGDGPVFPRGNTRDAEAPRREAPAAANGAPPRMTENQRRYLYRFLADRGFEGAAATDALCRAAEVRDVGDITKALASELIDAWKQDAEGGGRAA